MDLSFSPEQEAFRKDVRKFFHSHKDIVVKAREEWVSGLGFGPYIWDILHRLGERGWLCPTWPKEYGGLELPYIYRYIVMEEMEYYLDIYNTIGAGMAGPVILSHGTLEQKKKYLPRIARGEIEFALGYTEPEAGSDLGSLSIKAEDKGRHFVINGEKVFNTRCHYAQYHWLAARTRVAEKKHQGVTLFIVDLQTPGITVRPMFTVGGVRTNQVFYDDVKVPKDCVVGELDIGFYYIVEALNYERISPSSGLQRDFEQLVEYVISTKSGNNPLVSQKIAELAIDVETVRLFSWRVAWMLCEKNIPVYEAAMLKMLRAETQHRLADTALKLFGHRGQFKKGVKCAPLDGAFEHKYRDSLEYIIVGGTSEILRSQIALRGLELPRR